MDSDFEGECEYCGTSEMLGDYCMERGCVLCLMCYNDFMCTCPCCHPPQLRTCPFCENKFPLSEFFLDVMCLECDERGVEHPVN